VSNALFIYDDGIMESTPEEKVEVEKIERPQKKGGFFKELVKFVFFILVILIPLRFFVAQPFIVVGTSMEPTFSGGEYLIVDELSYHLGNPSRGDVIIFRPPLDPKVFYIKRVIGLPNETVEIKSGKVIIKNSSHPEGFVLDESYVKNQGEKDETTVLGAGQYFVMGDNRPVSYDSRSWGPVSRNMIVGRAFLRLLPPNRIGLLPGSAAESSVVQ
jgi:signal peptidase I